MPNKDRKPRRELSEEEKKKRIEAAEKRGRKLVDSREKVEVPPFRKNVPAERMSPSFRGS